MRRTGLQGGANMRKGPRYGKLLTTKKVRDCVDLVLLKNTTRVLSLSERCGILPAMKHPTIALWTVFLLLVGFEFAGAVEVEISPTQDGEFIGAWWVHPPTKSDKLGLESPLGSGKWQLLGSEGPAVDAGKTFRPGARRSTWFAINLVADHDMTVRLKVGADGKLRTWLDGQAVGNHVRPHYLLWDDHVLELTLSKGRHQLRLETSRKKRQKNAGWRVIARIVDGDGGFPTGLRLVLPDADPAALLASTARLTTSRTLTQQGYGLTIGVDSAGGRPSGATLPWTATVRGKTVASGNVGDRPATVELNPREGHYTLKVVAGSRKWSEKQVFNRAWNTGLIEATRALADPCDQNQATLDSIQYGIEKLTGLVLENISDKKWLGEQVRLVGSWAKAAAGGTDPFIAQRGSF
ncbi:MAG: hypothetical protein ACI9OJ_005788, partial [Myxococcota bacterium]